MSTSLKTSYSSRFTSILTDDSSALSDTNARISISFNGNLQDGTGDGQADLRWGADRTLAHGATDSFDLDDGSLKDAYQNAVQFVHLKSIVLLNTSTTKSCDLEIVFWSGDEYESVSSQCIIQPGGKFEITNPNGGFNVAPVTHDHVTVYNISASATASYTILLTGTSA